MALSSELRLPSFLAGSPVATEEALSRVPRALALQHDVLAYGVEAGELYVAIPDADDEEVLDRLRYATGLRVRATALPRDVIRERLSRVYHESAVTSLDRDNRDDAAPAVALVHEIHESALLAGASDLHIEPAVEGGRVRERVDGLLRDVRHVPQPLFGQVISRLKLLSGMDIADKRQPQDGRYELDLFGRSIDARVSSMPTIAGEKLVIRLLDLHARVPSLEHLGMSASLLRRFRRTVHAPHGFVIVCGPTGSGKTTTLYASLAERNTETQHVCTVEDPVEVRMPGIAQVQVNARAGLTFAATFRSFLRQDPNVVMIGEMRDEETASVAMSAALSGQLVLTTLHANDAPRSVDRLAELGIPRHAIAAGLSAALAQRLLRRLCARCRRRSSTDDTWKAAGCDACAGSGYAGRIAVFELLEVTDRIRDAIASGASSVSIAQIARDETAYRTMTETGLDLTKSGETSTEELRRVLYAGFDS